MMMIAGTGKQTGEGGALSVSLTWFLLLHASLLINSLPGVASKLAGRYPVMSLPFLFFCGLSILLLGIFAVVWQQVLRHMTLTFALTNKPVTIIYSLIWGVLIFHETVTPKMVVGSLIIIAGIIVGVTDHE